MQATVASPDTRLVSAPSAHRFPVLVDRVGATASLACAVHCIALPFVLALLPLVGLGFLAGHTFERVFVACAALLASASIIAGYRRYHRPQALLLVVPGIVLLVFGVAVELDANVVVHTAAVVAGGILVASAHITNLVFTHRLCGHSAHAGMAGTAAPEAGACMGQPAADA